MRILEDLRPLVSRMLRITLRPQQQDMRINGVRTRRVPPQIDTLHAKSSRIAAHTSFFSLQTWNNEERPFTSNWKPGDMDPDVSDDIVASLDVATNRWPQGSAAQVNTRRNFEYFQAVHHRMRASHSDNWWNWLPKWRPPPLIASLNVDATSSTVNSSLTTTNFSMQSTYTSAEEYTRK